MKPIPRISKDRDQVIFLYPGGPGNSPKVVTYFSVRGAISWPTGKSPGYYCIFGLKDEPTLSEKRPLELLAEGEAKIMEKLFEKVALSGTRLFCERLFADLREENEGFRKSFYRFVSERKIEGIYLSDSSEFENIEYGATLIKQWQYDNALKIGKDTILNDQLGKMTPEDLDNKAQERFYAVAAFIRVLKSFEAYPWRRSRRGPGGIVNWLDKDRSQDTGEYREIYVD